MYVQYRIGYLERSIKHLVVLMFVRFGLQGEINFLIQEKFAKVS